MFARFFVLSKLLKLYKSLAVEWIYVLGVVVIINKDIDYLEQSQCLSIHPYFQGVDKPFSTFDSLTRTLLSTLTSTLVTTCICWILTEFVFLGSYVH